MFVFFCEVCWVVSLVKVAVDNAETESSVCRNDDPACSSLKVQDASGLSVANDTFHSVILSRNTVLPFFSYYPWQIPT